MQGQLISPNPVADANTAAPATVGPAVGTAADRLVSPTMHAVDETVPGALGEGGSGQGDGATAGDGERREQSNGTNTSATAQVRADVATTAAMDSPGAAAPTTTVAAASGDQRVAQAVVPSTAPARSAESERGGKATSRAVQGETTTLTPAAREALAPLLALAERAHGAAKASEAIANPTPMPQSTTTPSDDADTNTPLVSRGLGALANQRGGTLSIRLDPPSLGDVRITMTVLNGRVSAELVTRTAEAQTLLRADLTALRQALESQGLSVDRLSVQSAPTQNSSTHGHGARSDAPTAMPTHAPPASSSSSSQQGQSDSGGQDRGQQQQDAGHGQSRGRSGDSGHSGQSSQREDRDGQSGSRSRRRASFARVFASSTLP